MSASGMLRARRGVVSLAVAFTVLAVVGGPIGSASAREASYGCTRTVAARTVPPQVVAAGEKLCLMDGAVVSGAVTVSPGGGLLVQSSVILGAVELSGAALFTICDSDIFGAITASGGTGPVNLGDNHLCLGSRFNAAVTLSDNTGAVRLAGNSIQGAVTVNGNSTGASTGPRIAANSIVDALSCAANTPKPTNTGRPNTVDGVRSGQCVAAAF